MRRIRGDGLIAHSPLLLAVLVPLCIIGCINDYNDVLVSVGEDGSGLTVSFYNRHADGSQAPFLVGDELLVTLNGASHILEEREGFKIPLNLDASPGGEIVFQILRDGSLIHRGFCTLPPSFDFEPHVPSFEIGMNDPPGLDIGWSMEAPDVDLRSLTISGPCFGQLSLPIEIGASSYLVSEDFFAPGEEQPPRDACVASLGIRFGTTGRFEGESSFQMSCTQVRFSFFSFQY